MFKSSGYWSGLMILMLQSSYYEEIASLNFEFLMLSSLTASPKSSLFL